MPIIETRFDQRSDEWFKARLGNPGASSMNKIITSAGKPSKTRQEYLFQMASEIIRGVSDETFKSEAMETGTIREDEARSLFELLYNVKVQQVAMVYKDEKKLYHASVDGLIGEDSGIEIKTPLGKTHAKYLYENKVPTQYFVQIQSSLYICERKYWWFLSYCPGMNSLCIRVNRDEAFISALDRELKLFNEELSETVAKISKG